MLGRLPAAATVAAFSAVGLGSFAFSGCGDAVLTSGAPDGSVTADGSARDDGPLAATTLKREVTVDGITVRFDQAVPVGHFISGANGEGDLFVVGPAVVTGYSPGPTVDDQGHDLNGAMVNPIVSTDSGLDGRSEYYVEEKNLGKQLPLTLNPGDSLVIATSRTDEAGLKRYIIVTGLAEIPHADSFRPPYTAGVKTLYRYSELDLSNLPTLALSEGFPSGLTISSRAQRASLDFIPGWNRNHIVAEDHLNLYGRNLSADMANSYLATISDLPLDEKKPHIISLVQNGIDRFALIQEGKAREIGLWYADGGHNLGRKPMMVIAGHLLGNDEMKFLKRSGFTFQEDHMSLYVTQEVIDVSNSDEWRPHYGDRATPHPFAQGTLGMPEFRGKPGTVNTMNANFTAHPYRLCCTYNVSHMHVLAIIAMGLEDAWDHDAFFDYHARHYRIATGQGDPWRFRGGDEAHYEALPNTEQALAGWMQNYLSDFGYAMFEKHFFEFYRYPWE